MGKASRKKQEARGQKTAPTSVARVSVSGDPRALGEEALGRLLRSNAPGKLSLAGAYAFGYGGLGFAQQEGTAPHWYREIDPLDALFLGTVWPQAFEDEYEFANARDAWLRLLRGTVHGKGIQRFVREAVLISEELRLPVDDGHLMLALAGRLEAAGLDQRRIPRRFLPGEALDGCRAVFGPPSDLRFPDPPADAKERVRRFWKSADEEERADDTPEAILGEGLRRIRDAGLPVKKDSLLLLVALYAALMAKPGELVEDLGEHASAWALSMGEASTLVPVLDILLLAPAREMPVADVLGHLFAIPAFTEPIPSEALLWTSSPGLALSRLAFELGISSVTTRDTVITADMLDWVGMHARMSLSAAARRSAAALAEAEGDEEADRTPEGEDTGWAERRQAVREAVRQKVHKKSGGTAANGRRIDRPFERIWNADGSSVMTFSTDSAQGQEIKKSLEAQRSEFRRKFGRDPGPEDPVFFDPDAEEPTPLTKKYFDDALLRMAEQAEEMGMDPAFLHAWREVGYVVTTETRHMFTAAEVIAFSRAVARHQQVGE